MGSCLLRVVGVVSESDLLAKVELTGQPHPRLFAGPRRRAARAHAAGAVAGELMSTPVITVAPAATLPAAARLMDRAQVKRLPVVDGDGRLIGIVTRGDLLKVYLRPDADIRQDVVREVLSQVLVVQDGTVSVAVAGGVVTLRGQVDRRSTAAVAVRLAYDVPGVVRVADRLGYDYDDSELASIGAVA